jgi:eukaryotic-like serine/threonine-protein kinase
MTDEKAERPEPDPDPGSPGSRPEPGDLGAASPPPDDAPPPLVDGSRDVGPYRLIRVLGRGGMGVVYLAEQTRPIRRRVALKVFKGDVDSKRILARFESERQALAVMDHPNIAKVFDGGVTTSGHPYFAMEVVYGIPITRYANNNRMSVNQRLRLFLSVCSAVQHAHLKGVIHRDLKPSNVLVVSGGPNPVVKVIDFGLAKAVGVGVGLTEHTIETMQGQQLGTPDYMSPEQASMSGIDVDTRTDVYSLGTMLYELLVGCRPLVLLASPGHDLARALEETEVPRPSLRLKALEDSLDSIAHQRGTTPDSLRSQLKGDLDWIILKAMEKDRRRRYDTISGLAMDIMRYLDDEPILARAPSPWYRMGKFVRRHRAGVVAASVAILAILAGGAAATVGLLQAVEERNRAEQSALAARQATDFLADLFEASDPARTGGEVILARDLLDRGAARIDEELAGQPTLQALLLRTIGVAYQRLGDFDAAAGLLERAVALGEGASPSDEAEVAHALQRLGMVYRVQGRAAEAESTLQKAIEVRRNVDTSYSPELLSKISSLAGLYISLGRFAEAAPLLGQVAAMQESLLDPDDPDLAGTYFTWGALHLRVREARTAMPYLERSLAIRERAFGPDHPLVARTLLNLGAGRIILEEWDEAERVTRRSAEIFERSLGPDHLELGFAWNNLGEIHFARGEYGAAEDYLLRSWRVKEAAVGPGNPHMPSTYRMLGNVYREQGRLDEAETLYRNALAILEASVEPGDPTIVETLEDLARLLRLTGRDGDAAEIEARAAPEEADAPTG